MIASFHEHIEEAENLADELNELLATESFVLKGKGMHDKAEELADWARCYRMGLRSGLPAESEGCEYGNAWLAGVIDRLRLETQAFDNAPDLGAPAAPEFARPETGDFTGDFIKSARHVSHTVSGARHATKERAAFRSFETDMQQF